MRFIANQRNVIEYTNTEIAYSVRQHLINLVEKDAALDFQNARLKMFESIDLIFGFDLYEK